MKKKTEDALWKVLLCLGAVGVGTIVVVSHQLGVRAGRTESVSGWPAPPALVTGLTRCEPCDVSRPAPPPVPPSVSPSVPPPVPPSRPPAQAERARPGPKPRKAVNERPSTRPKARAAVPAGSAARSTTGQSQSENRRPKAKPVAALNDSSGLPVVIPRPVGPAVPHPDEPGAPGAPALVPMPVPSAHQHRLIHRVAAANLDLCTELRRKKPDLGKVGRLADKALQAGRALADGPFEWALFRHLVGRRDHAAEASRASQIDLPGYIKYLRRQAAAERRRTECYCRLRQLKVPQVKVYLRLLESVTHLKPSCSSQVAERFSG